MQFQVPQFIETEDKVVGPFSIRQFAYVGAACLVSAICYFLVSTWLAILVAFILIGGALALSFMKVEGRPLITVLLAAANYYWKPQTYVWQAPEPEKPKPVAKPVERAFKLPDLPTKVATRAPEPKSAPSYPAAPAMPAPRQAAPAPAPVRQARPAPAPKPAARGGSFEDVLAGVLAQKREAAESIAEGSSLHRSWQSVLTGESSKISGRQLVENKMNERYEIYQKVSGERTAAKRVDYR